MALVDDQQDQEFRDRLVFVLQRLGSLQAAAEKTGFSTDQIAKWRDGKARPPFKPLAILAKASGMTLDWLAYGVKTLAYEEAGGSRAGGFAENDPDLMAIPMHNVIASAGNGRSQEPVEEVSTLPFSRRRLLSLGVNPNEVSFIQATGDSMEPTIKDGALVLVDLSKTEIRGGAIYVVSLHDEVRIKRVHRSISGSVTLISDNPAYPPDQLQPGDAKDLVVHGRVFLTEMVL